MYGCLRHTYHDKINRIGMIMEQSTLKCIYEFTNCNREYDCTNCEIKNRYYKDIYSDKNHNIDEEILVEPDQPILITA